MIIFFRYIVIVHLQHFFKKVFVTGVVNRSAYLLLAPYHIKAVLSSKRQHGLAGSNLWCSYNFDAIGKCTDPNLVYMHSYFQFNMEMNTFVSIKRALLSFYYGDNVNTADIWFTINLHGSTIYSDCDSMTPQARSLSGGIDVSLKSAIANSVGVVDVTELVQRAINDEYWPSYVTFVFYQNNQSCSSSEEVIIDFSKSMVLNVYYDDFKPSENIYILTLF